MEFLVLDDQEKACQAVIDHLTNANGGVGCQAIFGTDPSAIIEKARQQLNARAVNAGCAPFQGLTIDVNWGQPRMKDDLRGLTDILATLLSEGYRRGVHWEKLAILTRYASDPNARMALCGALANLRHYLGDVPSPTVRVFDKNESDLLKMARWLMDASQPSAPSAPLR